MADNSTVRYLCAILFPCLLILAGLLRAEPASGQVRADHSHRLDALFDFEETDDRGIKLGFAGQFMPPYWYPIGRQPLGPPKGFEDIPLHVAMRHRPGYPTHATLRYDQAEKTSGHFSFFLGLVGGKTGAYIQTGVINVTPGSDYLITANVKTRELQFAWAEVRAYYVDGNKDMIPESVQRSRPIQSGDDWARNIAVKLRGDFDQAEFLVIELLILQPEHDPTHVLGDHQVVPRDTEGGAWFDDIAVWELPSIELRTAESMNIVSAPSAPEFGASVRDLTGHRLTAHLNVYDLNHKLVDHMSKKVGGAGNAADWSWAPTLPGYGWYYSELLVYDDTDLSDDVEPIARTLNAMLWLPRDPGDLGPDLGRFVLLSEDVDDADLGPVSALVKEAGIRGVVLSAWARHSTPQTTITRQELMDSVIRDLALAGGKVTLSFWPLPIELATKLGIDSHDPLAALSADAGIWGPYSEPVFIRHGQRVRDWQIGSSSRPDAFFTLPLDERLLGIEKDISVMTPSPRVVVPWRLDQPRRPEVDSGGRHFAVAWPQGITPDNLDQALKGWPVPPEELRLDIELAPADQMSQSRRVADLMLRVLHAWELGVGSLGLDKPWSAGYERRRSIMPDPVLGAWVQTSRMLAGQRVIGRMPLGPGMQCMILDGRQGGMLVAWNENADTSVAEVALYLGDEPIAHGPFGNTETLAKLGKRHILTLGPTPVFITGIDARLAELRAGFTLDDPFIESTQLAHQRTLRLHNPFPRTMNGELAITGPSGWAIQPSMHRFSIAPGRTIEIPLTMRFPIQEPGGIKALTAEVKFETDDTYAVTLYTPIELGLRDVEFAASVVLEPGREPGTTDAVVTLNATNRGTGRIGLYLFATLFDHPRRELLVPGIEPGSMVTRRMRFTDVGEQVGQFPLRCGVREINGPAVLNHILDLRRPGANGQQDGPLAGAE